MTPVSTEHVPAHDAILSELMGPVQPDHTILPCQHMPNTSRARIQTCNICEATHRSDGATRLWHRMLCANLTDSVDQRSSAPARARWAAQSFSLLVRYTGLRTGNMLLKGTTRSVLLAQRSKCSRGSLMSTMNPSSAHHLKRYNRLSRITVCIRPKDRFTLKPARFSSVLNSLRL
jgi:hypothetical protein